MSSWLGCLFGLGLIRLVRVTTESGVVRAVDSTWS